MSLKVWLPLNGTLDNLGCSNTVVTNIGATVNTAGKIGSCYHFGTASSYMTLPADTMTNFTTCSVAFWLKIKTWNTSYATYFQAGKGGSAWNNYIFGFLRNNANSTVCFTISNGSTASNASYLTSTLTLNQWYHVALTYETGKCKIYLNGALDNEYTTTIVPNFAAITKITLGVSNATSSYQTDCDMNDVRIYDHCLSAAEVREISQGLVLHYKLDDAIGFTDLIARGTTWTIYNNHNNTNMPSTLVDTGNVYNGDKVYRETCTPTDNSINSIRTSLGSHGVYNWRRTFTANTKYVFWIYYKPISHSDTRCGGTASNIGGWAEIPPVEVGGGWYRVGAYRNGTVTTDKTDNIFVSFKVPSATVGNPIIIDWASPHLLEGTTEIPPYDYPSTIIQDSSGYNHSGTITGTISIDSDSPRYQSSTYVNGSSYILTSAGSFAWNDLTQLTFSAWMKPTASMTGWRGSVGIAADANQNSRGIAITDYANEFRGTYTNGSGYATVATGKTLPQNEWHHCAGTLNGTEFKLYFDGALVKTQTIDWGTATLNANTRFEVGVDLPGTDEKFTGSYSDVRCYCTALDADAIRQLYEVGAKVDNKNQLHAFEFIEPNKQEITKYGQVKAQNILETYLPLYDKTIYEEPDGSQWIHIFHHNNPTNSKFNEPTLDWTTGKYLDANRWYDVDQAVYHTLGPYEFLYKQKTTSSATETKYRWIQTANPLTATWADVKPGTITANTSSGYSACQGGLYPMKNSNLHMCIANSTNGNWYGGIGAAAAYQGGIPGYPNTVVTSGCIDLYLRVYSNTKIIKNVGISSAEFIEL